MSDRYQLNQTIGRLQTVLVRAARFLPLDQPIRSSDLYDQAERTINDLIADVEKVLERNDIPTRRKKP